MAAMVSSKGAPTIQVMRWRFTSGEQAPFARRVQVEDRCAPVELGEDRLELGSVMARSRMLVFIVSPTMPNSSMALVISVIDASTCGSGVAAYAGTGRMCGHSAAYSSLTNRGRGDGPVGRRRHTAAAGQRQHLPSTPARSISRSRASSSVRRPRLSPAGSQVSVLPSPTSRSR